MIGGHIGLDPRAIALEHDSDVAERVDGGFHAVQHRHDGIDIFGGGAVNLP